MMIGICLTCYFSYHTVFGERSYLKLKTLSYQVEAQTSIYENIRSRRMRLENRVVRLRPQSLDADLLEEQARHVLGFVYPQEQIIMTTDTENNVSGS